MPGWDALLERLADAPRENGTAAIHETAQFLARMLREGGVDVELVPFTAHPYGLRLAGVIALAGAILYARLLLSGRHLAALATALVVPAVLLAQLDYYVPLFAWIGGETQHHVVGRVHGPRPEQRLILAAHYDTKTDLLDHVQRAPVDLLAIPLVPLMIFGAAGAAAGSRFPRHARLLRGLGRFAALAVALYGGAAFLALSAGAFLPARSPGALDDGASCALLVRLAQELAAAPLERSDVEVLLLSAEEVGVQGSWRYAAERFRAPPELPTWVVNLEAVGASAAHAVLRRERFTLRSFAPDPRLVERLDAVHRRRLREPLGVTFHGGATDARSFLAHGIPAATLVTREPGKTLMRGLHSARDSRARVDLAALDASLEYLVAVVRDLDRRPLEGR